MVRTVQLNRQTSSKDLQHDLVADGVAVLRSNIQRTLHREMLYERVMRKKPFSAHMAQTVAWVMLKHMWTSQLHFGIRCRGLMKLKIELFGHNEVYMAEDKHIIPRQTLAPHSKIWWFSIMLCGQYWQSCSSWRSHGFQSVSADPCQQCSRISDKVEVAPGLDTSSRQQLCSYSTKAFMQRNKLWWAVQNHWPGPWTWMRGLQVFLWSWQWWKVLQPQPGATRPTVVAPAS